MGAVKLPTDAPVIGIAEFRKILGPEGNRAQQVTVAAYDSIERWQHRPVVVSPKVTAPTWVRHPEARTRALCLVVPDLDALTADLCTQVTHIRATYFGVRDLFTRTLIRQIERTAA